MKTLRRYIGREIYLATGVILVAFLALFAFFDLVNELRDVGRAGYRLEHAVLHVLLSLPGHVYELFPIAVLIGTLYALSDLAAKSEYTVMRASGMTPRQAVGAMARVGVVLVVVCALFGELVTPVAERFAQRVRLGAMGSVLSQDLRSGVWVKSKSRFVNIGQVLPDMTVRNIRLYEFDEGYRLKSISEAKQGEYAGQQLWRYTDVVETRFTEKGAEVATVPSLEWESVLTPEVLAVLTVDPQKMPAWNLFQYTRHLAENKQRTERYEIALWKKVFYPFAVMVMMALALPFAYIHARRGGLGIKIFAGIALGVLFHGMNTLFSYLGVLQNWPPVVSAALPSALFLAAAIAMLSWAERR